MLFLFINLKINSIYSVEYLPTYQVRLNINPQIVALRTPIYLFLNI